MEGQNNPPSAPSRGAWSSKWGFILAASGAAIGLGNVIFFASNAYQYGGGAFYLPYFLALFVLGIPMMIIELGLGTMTGRSFPEALRRVAGKKGEFVGWLSLGGALFITMIYITLLGWALGMMLGTLGDLFEPGVTAPFAPFAEAADTPNPQAYFFNMISTYGPMLSVVLIWALNLLALWKGASTIERAVRLFVPLMWVFMIGLVIIGLTLDGGLDGVFLLFKPDWQGIAEPGVWQGAFAQLFFSLSLGLGSLTAYASYLPKDADQVNNAMTVSFLNCGFEYVAGIAIFSLLFAFALTPVGGSISLSFFVIPQGLSALPWDARLFGFLFFFLLVIAGLTSSFSMIEGQASALIDTLGFSRVKALAWVAVPGLIGSLCFALPQIIDPALDGNGTLGLTLRDVMDHWAFNYTLIIVGLLECLLVGWVLGADKLREAVNAHSTLRLGAWFDVLVKYVAPALLFGVLAWNLYTEATAGSLYGTGPHLGGYGWIPVVIPSLWLLGTLAIAVFLTSRPASSKTPLIPA